MQFKASVLATVALATLAAATPTRRTDTPASQCNTGDLQCCNSTQDATSSSIAGLLGLLGVVVGDITGLVGLNCSPLSVIGIAGNSCSAQPVCCTDNSFGGLIAVGCSPVNVNL